MKNKLFILLSTYNGARYLHALLDSLQKQTYRDFQILARDDGSSDSIVEILESYNIKILDTKENLGAKKSFGALLDFALQNSDSEYFMFCDQDDVWEKDKIEKTLAKIQKMEIEYGDIPLLVHTDLEVVDEKLHMINSSFMNFQKIDPFKNRFRDLLMQNTITGCTLMFNRKLAQKCLPISDGVIMHDWWIGLIAGQFGKIGYLNESTIKYRQHIDNTIGAKRFGPSFIMKSIFSKKISLNENIFQAKVFLERFENELDIKTKIMLQEFTTLRQKTFWQKRVILWKYRLLKQGFIRNIGLLLKI